MTNDSQQLQIHFKQFFSSNSLRINLFRHVVSFSQIGVLQFFMITFARGIWVKFQQVQMLIVAFGTMFECSVRRLRASENGKQNGWSMKQLFFFNPSLKLGISKKPFNWNQIPCYNSVYSKSAAGKETSSVLSFKKKRKLNWPLQFLFTPQRTWWFSDVLFQF